MLICFTASSGDYNPFANPLLSEWVRDCYNGDLSAVKKQLEAEPTILEKRESVLRLSGLFHIIAGARTVKSTMLIPDELKARVSDETGVGTAVEFSRHRWSHLKKLS